MIKKLLLAAVALCSSFYINDYATVRLDRTHFRDLQKEVQKEVECLALNIYHEAALEPLAGQIAVAFVTFNRMVSGHFPNSVCKVVYQRKNGVCQFSWVCIKNHLKIDRQRYEYIKSLATLVYLNKQFYLDPTFGATFYHADYVNPRWKLEVTTVIGRHIFYKM